VLIELLGSLLLALVAPNVSADVSATDSEGRRITLPQAAERIVALAPHIVENLYSIGAGKRVIGAVQYSDYPPVARDIPRVGGVAAISLERIAALDPDLIVLWGSATPPALRAGLERLGYRYFVDEIRSLEELAQSLRALGQLTARNESAENAAARVSEAISRHPATSAAKDSDPSPGVLLQLWDQPLQSIGPAHILSEIIQRCGGQSISDSGTGLAPLISLEQVLAVDPELIIVENEAQGRHWLRYPQLRAVANGRVTVINPDLLQRPTLRLLDGMREICRHIRQIDRPETPL
jgi:iron complex transport system substrate-binding protein